MASMEPLYLGFDLSTQQLKGLAVTSSLKVQYEAKFDFDDDSTGFDVRKGVITNEDEHEVYAPVALWLQAIDKLLGRLENVGMDFSRVKGISGAGQQHGSVYWSEKGEYVLRNLDKEKSLEEQLVYAFSHPFSPNWQDASTQKECDAFDKELGSTEQLAQCTGSKAHHRFTGPQILRFHRRHQKAYEGTSHISLVSSFLASIFLGEIAPCDISDVCGMNLWDIKAGAWSEKLIALASGHEEKATDLKNKLDDAFEDQGGSLGTISPYFVQKYNFNPSCSVTPFTGDNPATLLALPLRPSDAIVSLGTSTTFLMSTPYYKPDPAVHFFNHPTTAGLYMFMLCYKNGGLARELIRDAINTDGCRQDIIDKDAPPKSWVNFDKLALTSPILGQLNETDAMKMGLYFPRPEIVPNVRAGEWRYMYDPDLKTLREAVGTDQGWIKPDDDARAIVESQLLSLRLRSRDLVQSPGDTLPPQPRRIYLVGGGSQNTAIARITGEVLGGSEGVYRLDVGQNACALGAAYKAVWAVERKPGETFEDFIGARWKEDEFVEKIAEGYQKGVFERYGQALEGFELMEKQVLEQDSR